MTHCMLTPATPTMSGFPAREMSQLSTRLHGRVTESPICVGPIIRRTLPSKFPPYSIFRAKGGQKTIKFCSNFHGVTPDTNYKHFECFVMLGTYSQLCRYRSNVTHKCQYSCWNFLSLCYFKFYWNIFSLILSQEIEIYTKFLSIHHVLIRKVCVSTCNWGERYL